MNKDSIVFEVSCFEIFEIKLESLKIYSNPFADITVSAVFKAPSGRKLTAYGFYDGGDIWKIRIAPDEEGMWSYNTAASDATNTELHYKTGTFRCVASSNKGFIRVDPVRKYWFSYSDGSSFFGMGDTCYGMVSSIGYNQRLNYLDTRSAQKFNFVRFFPSGYPENACQELDVHYSWPWGGTPEVPEYDKFNPEFFWRLEAILDELKSRGMYAEIEVFNLYSLQKAKREMEFWVKSKSYCEQWARYIVSRLAAYTTVFLWTVTNEYETYPDGIYRYDAPDDDWVREMCTVFHECDPHGHPTTVHPEQRYPGKLFGKADELDVITHQQNSYGTAKWYPEPAPGYWDGPGSEAGDDILAERRDNKPVINTENGYEWLKDYPSNFARQSHGTDKCRKTAWRIFTAGGAAYSAGFGGTWSGVSVNSWRSWETGEVEGPIPFKVADMGLARQLGYFYDFITTKTDFLNMDTAMHRVNSPNLCLANIGREYVVFAPYGGSVNLKLDGVDGTFSVVWLNPRDGKYSETEFVAGGEIKKFTAPDHNDWVLHLKLQ